MFTRLNIISFGIAIIFGFIGFYRSFADLNPDESMLDRVIFEIGLYLIAGLAIGFINPDGWFLSGFAAWGGFLWWGLAMIFAVNKYGWGAWSRIETPDPLSLAILILPLCIAMIGGYLGKILRN